MTSHDPPPLPLPGPMESTREERGETARRHTRAGTADQLHALPRLEAPLFVGHSVERRTGAVRTADWRSCSRNRGAVMKRRSPETIARESVHVDMFRAIRVWLPQKRAWGPVAYHARAPYVTAAILREAIAAAIRADRKQRKGAKRK